MFAKNGESERNERWNLNLLILFRAKALISRFSAKFLNFNIYFFFIFVISKFWFNFFFWFNFYRKNLKKKNRLFFNFFEIFINKKIFEF